MDSKATKASGGEESELEKALAGIANGNSGANDDASLEFQEAPVPTVDDILTGKTSEQPKAAAPSGSLKNIKNSVLSDLKPLVGKVNLPAEERFELLMQIFDATNDTELIGEAYNAAKEIADDTVKAESLLHIIREIDNLS